MTVSDRRFLRGWKACFLLLALCVLGALAVFAPYAFAGEPDADAGEQDAPPSVDAPAVLATQASETYNLWIDGVRATSENEKLAQGGISFSYDEETRVGTLWLDNARIRQHPGSTADGIRLGDTAEDDPSDRHIESLVIHVRGANSITSTDGAGILADADFSIVGEGESSSLRVEGATYGICATGHRVSIEGAAVSAKAVGEGAVSVGLAADGVRVSPNARLEAVGESAGMDVPTAGIDIGGKKALFADDFSGSGAALSDFGDTPPSARQVRLPGYYVLTLDAAGGDCDAATLYTDADGKVDEGGLPKPTRVGYRFAGWFTDDGDQVVDAAGNSNEDVLTTQAVSDSLTRDRTLHARWELIEYAIRYILNDMATSSALNNNPTSYNVESGTIELAQPTRDGYTFTGWTWGSIVVPTISAIIPAGGTGDMVFEANWVKEASASGDGGSGSSGGSGSAGGTGGDSGGAGDSGNGEDDADDADGADDSDDADAPDSPDASESEDDSGSTTGAVFAKAQAPTAKATPQTGDALPLALLALFAGTALLLAGAAGRRNA